MDVNEMTDRLGRGLDPSVKRAVKLFNAAGLRTLASCGGHVRRALPGAWVDFPTELLPILESYADEFNAISQERPVIRVLSRTTHVRVTTLVEGYLGRYQRVPRRPEAEEGLSLREYGRLSRKVITKFAEYVYAGRMT